MPVAGDLKMLVESVVSDLVEARFEADVRAAELAEHYRNHEGLRGMRVPALNITNVSIELRFAFDDTPIEPADGPSDAQKEAVAAKAAALRETVMATASVAERATSARARSTISRNLGVVAERAMQTGFAASPAERMASVELALETQLARTGVKLNAKEAASVKAAVAEMETAFAAAPKAPPKSMPKLIVGRDALSEAPEDRISSIAFDVDLSDARWTDMDDGAGGVRSVLTQK